jgi:hypothetical protein
MFSHSLLRACVEQDPPTHREDAASQRERPPSQPLFITGIYTHTHTQIKLPSAVTHEGTKKIAPAARPVRHTPDRPPGAEKKIGYQTTVTPRPKTAKNRCARARAPRAPLAILGSARGGYLQCMGFMGSYGTKLVPYGVIWRVMGYHGMSWLGRPEPLAVAY